MKSRCLHYSLLCLLEFISTRTLDALSYFFLLYEHCKENEDAKTQPLEEPFIYVQHIVYVQPEEHTSCCQHDSREVVNILVNGLGRLRLVQLSFQVTETTVAAQNLDGLLLHGGGGYSQVLETGESRVPLVCEVELENTKRSAGL